jgi:replicative DNA helicase
MATPDTAFLDRIPPQALEAEQAALGAMLLEREAVERALELLREEDFYREAHRVVFSAIVELHRRREPVDLITVGEVLRSRDRLDAVGGTLYLTTLMSQVPTAAGITHYARIIREKSTARQLIRTLSETVDACYTGARDADAILQEVSASVMAISDASRSDDVEIRQLWEYQWEALKDMHREDEQGQVMGIRTGIPTLDEIIDPMLPGDFIIVAARPSMGKCLALSSLLSLSDGTVKMAKDIVPGDEVISITDDFRVTSRRCSASFSNGKKPLFRLRMGSGRTMDVTGNHPFRTLDGWWALDDLAVGSRIALITRAIHGTCETISVERARLLGYLVADGGLTQGTPRYTKMHAGVVDDVCACLRHEFPTVTLRPEPNAPAQYSITTGQHRHENPVTAWLRELGVMGNGAADKHVPDEILRGTAAIVSHFLHGLFTGDGSLYRNGATGWTMEYSSMSERLVRQVADLLLRFGIVSAISSKHTNFDTTAWRLRVTDPMSVHRLVTEIGIGAGKTDAYERQPDAALRSNIYNTPKEIWPYIRERVKARGMTMEALVGHPLGGSTYKRDIGRDRLQRYADLLDDDRLRALASAEVWWDTIAEITPLGVEETWDLTVEGTHNFVSDGIVSHNTVLGFQIAKNAAREGEKVLFVSVEMGCKSVAKRSLYAEANVSAQLAKRIDLRKAKENHHLVYGPMYDAVERDQRVQLYLVKPPTCCPDDVLNYARKCKQRHGGLSLVVVDYLQLMRANDAKLTDSYQKVTSISTDMKGVAAALGVPVICIAQLSRSVESRTRKRPMLSDLRDSGKIEEDADVVAFLYRPGYYDGNDWEENRAAGLPPGDDRTTEIIVAKQRNGQAGVSARLSLNKEVSRFDEIDNRYGNFE